MLSKKKTKPTSQGTITSIDQQGERDKKKHKCTLIACFKYADIHDLDATHDLQSNQIEIKYTAGRTCSMMINNNIH